MRTYLRPAMHAYIIMPAATAAFSDSAHPGMGRRVCVITSDKSYEALALRLQSDGALVVQPDGAAEHPVYAGDVSVRGIMGYV